MAEWFRWLLLVFGLSVALVGLLVVWQSRSKPPDASFIRLLGALYLCVGAAALVAAVWRSGVAFVAMAILALSIPAARTARRRRTKP
jgi:hypothetical protein